MGLQSTVNNTEQLQTHYDNVFLHRFKDVLRLDNWADKKDIPLWSGKTVSYFAYYPILEDADPITEGSSTANEVTVTGQTVEATVAKYAQWRPHTELMSLTARDKNLEKQVGLFGEAAGRSLELALAKEYFQNGSIPIRTSQLSNSATYTIESTVDASAGNSTTFFYDDAIVHTSDLFEGAHMVVRYGATRNYRYGGIVSVHGSTAEGFTMTKAAPLAFSANTTYRMVVGTGIVAAQLITGSAINYCVSKAREYGFYPYEDGWFKSTLASQVEVDLQKYQVFINLGQYQQSEKIEKGFIGSLWGVKFSRTTMPYRESVAGVYSSTGVVFCTPIMGMHSLANVGLGGMKGHRVHIKNPGPQSTNEPYNEKGTLGYSFYAAPKSLNAAFGINLMSGATGIT